jgi:hypothetical protein
VWNSGPGGFSLSHSEFQAGRQKSREVVESRLIRALLVSSRCLLLLVSEALATACFSQINLWEFAADGRIRICKAARALTGRLLGFYNFLWFSMVSVVFQMFLSWRKQNLATSSLASSVALGIFLGYLFGF